VVVPPASDLLFTAESTASPATSAICAVLPALGLPLWCVRAVSHVPISTTSLTVACPGASPTARPSTSADCVLYVTAGTGLTPSAAGWTLAAYAAGNGTLLWSWDAATAMPGVASTSVTSGPVLDAAGCLYVTAFNGTAPFLPTEPAAAFPDANVGVSGGNAAAGPLNGDGTRYILRFC